MTKKKTKLTQMSSGYYKAPRKNHTANTPMMGIEWEIPFITSDNFRTSYSFTGKNPFEHMNSHIDSGCVEIKTPIGDFGQQKRWVKTLVKLVQDFNTPIKGMCGLRNDGGIHIHVSQAQEDREEHSYSFCYFTYSLILEMNTKYGGNFWPRVTHRAVNPLSCYYSNATSNRSIQRVQRSASLVMLHTELRSFKSHPALLLPALEFQHAFLKQYNKKCKDRTDLKNFEKMLKNSPQYSSAWELYQRTVELPSPQMVIPRSDRSQIEAQNVSSQLPVCRVSAVVMAA